MRKKDKLYVRPVILPQSNMFNFGGTTASWDKAASNDYGSNYGNTGFTMNDYKNSTNWLGLSKVDNPFSKGNLMGAFSKESIGGALKGAAGSLLGTAATAIGGVGNKLISGGLSSGAGRVISNIGGTIGGAIGMANPVLGGIVNVGSQLVGGLTNRIFGMKTDQEKLNSVNNSINQNLNFVSNAGDFDSIVGPQAVSMDTNVYEGGWASGSKARRKNRALKTKLVNAVSFADRSVDNNIHNIAEDQLLTAMGHISAFGGPLGQNNDMGVLDYDIMSDYLAIKKNQATNKNKMQKQTFGMMPQGIFAIGGDLQTHGADWSTGATTIGAGGTHEENPYQGVQVGVDNQGVPNLVEENEVIYNDYVYSNRILLDEDTKKKFHFSKKKDLTFAEAAQKLEKEIKERPNDPISKAGFKSQMLSLADEQERQKQLIEAEKARLAFESMPPEEQVALIQQKANEEALAQQEMIAAQQPIEMTQPSPEEMVMQEQPMTNEMQGEVPIEPILSACGGKINRYDGGGYLWDNLWVPINEYSKQRGNNANKYKVDKTLTKKQVKELENSINYKRFTDYILNNATDEERLNYFNWIDANTGSDNKYIVDGALVNNWQDRYTSARNDGLYGIQHYTPEYETRGVSVMPETIEEVTFNAPTLPDSIENPSILKGQAAITSGLKPGEDDNSLPTGYRKAGLLGPLVGLGLMEAGVGKPNYSRLDAAIDSSVHTAGYKPLGNYLRYNPMDIWFAQNRMDANARATDRQIMNNASPIGTKIAGLLASGYNNQIADGELYRKALEYNDAQRQKVAEFNRGTDQFNADAFNRTSQFNASAYNQVSQARATRAMQAAVERMNRDAAWNSNLYGNIGAFFKGLGDYGTENLRWNVAKALGKDGIAGVLGDSNTGKLYNAKGGKLNRKKNKRRGLTY